ncbi:uncharacterized protein LOC144005391 isoform X3 [Festucalex cinctus]
MAFYLTRPLVKPPASPDYRILRLNHRGQTCSRHRSKTGKRRRQSPCRPTVSEAERSEKHWQARRLLHRLLSGVIGHRLPPETNKTVEQGSPLHVHQGGFKTPKSLVLETKTTMKMTLPRFLG